MTKLKVLDLFSAAAGGWSLGLHRAGFKTMAACENVAWRRALYQENNPDVRIYDDVCTLTADRIVRDCGCLPDYVVGSPPCQDISSANTKGKGVEGERSGLFFEEIRIIGETRPRGFALENSPNLRTRGADAVLAALEAIGYACWPFVVGVKHFTDSPHERDRAWVIGFDLDQVANASSWEQREQSRRRDRPNWSSPSFNGYDDPAKHTSNSNGIGWDDRRCGRWGGFDISVSDNFIYAPGQRHESGRSRRHWQDGNRPSSIETGARNSAHADQAGQAGQADGCMVASLRQEEISVDGRDDVGGYDGQGFGQVGRSSGLGNDFAEPWAGWNSGLAGHLRVDDGLSAWVAGTRIAVGGPKGTSAASLIVEAFGDAVVPQIPEAIGRAMIRTEAALRAVYGSAAA